MEDPLAVLRDPDDEMEETPENVDNSRFLQNLFVPSLDLE